MAKVMNDKLEKQMQDLTLEEKSLVLNQIIFEIDFATDTNLEWAFTDEERKAFKQLAREIEKAIPRAKQAFKQSKIKIN